MALIFATNNKHKLTEIKDIVRGLYDVKGLHETGILEEIPEPYETLQENAIAKVTFIYEKYGFECFADDTGLEIESLDGRPGVYSARYAGEGCSFDDNVKKVLAELEGHKNRKASFRTVIALLQNGQIHTFEGEVPGEITTERHGNEGFGYDPIFLPSGFSQTFAEMPLSLKNTISHRARALEKFLYYLKSS